MANTQSAKKRMKQGAAARDRNRARTTAVKTQMRKFLDAVHDNELDKARAEFRATTQMLDKIASTSTLHKNTAARRKSRLAARLNALEAAGK